MVEINEAFDVLSDPVKRFDFNRSLDRAAREKATRQDASADSTKQRSQRSRPSRATSAPADDPVRRARREAKERAAAEAAKRGYRDPGAGRMNFSAPD